MIDVSKAIIYCRGKYLTMMDNQYDSLLEVDLQNATNTTNERQQFVFEDGRIYCNAKRRLLLTERLYTLQYDAGGNVGCGDDKKGQPEEQMTFVSTMVRVRINHPRPACI